MSGKKRGKGEILGESLTWVSSMVSTLKSARTRRAVRAKKRVVVKRVEYIVEVFRGVKIREGGRRDGPSESSTCREMKS